MKLRNHASGFTLLELLVTIALIALVIGLVVRGSDNLFDRQMKKASNRLASTMRYLYNKAATDGLFIRLVIDFEEQSYWIEATRDPYLIESAAEVEKKKEKENEEEKVKEKPVEEGEKKLPKLKPIEPTFDKSTERLLRPQSLPDSIYFKDVHVEHQEEVVERGRAMIAFFPNGYVQHAIINLRDADDETHYSLETNPVNGRVIVEAEYKALERLE